MKGLLERKIVMGKGATKHKKYRGEEVWGEDGEEVRYVDMDRRAHGWVEEKGGGKPREEVPIKEVSTAPVHADRSCWIGVNASGGADAMMIE